MKNLLWDREEGSETVWHTVKPRELRGLEPQHLKVKDTEHDNEQYASKEECIKLNK